MIEPPGLNGGIGKLTGIWCSLRKQNRSGSTFWDPSFCSPHSVTYMQFANRRLISYFGLFLSITFVLYASGKAGKSEVSESAA